MDAFVVRHEGTHPDPAVEGLSVKEMSWRQAGERALFLSIFAVIVFGFHYWRFGTSEGEPPRGTFLIALMVLSVVIDPPVAWRGRLRLLAATSTAMALIGLHLHYVIGNHIEPEAWIAAFAAINVIVWIARDALAYLRRAGRDGR